MGGFKKLNEGCNWGDWETREGVFNMCCLIIWFAIITIREKSIRYMIRFGNVKVSSVGVFSAEYSINWADWVL